MKLNTILLSVALLLLTLSAGCSTWRVFQAEVPKDVEKPKAQVQGEKRAAELIQLITTPPVANPGEAVKAVHEVATELSSSLGKPDIPVTLNDQSAVIKELRAGLLAKDQQLERWKAFGRKYAGRELEGTGFDLGPWLGTGGLLAVVALCVFIPGAGFAILRVIPVLWGMIRRMATGIEGFTMAEPVEGSKLKHAYLDRTMNEVDKTIIVKRKKKIPEKVIQKLAEPLAA